MGPSNSEQILVSRGMGELFSRGELLTSPYLRNAYVEPFKTPDPGRG
jgi:hypothetical protein